MDIRSRSELQLLRVSRGAHELTQMIDSWKKASNVGGQRDYIANDLLQGALQLQESLLMLSRIQEASSKISSKAKIRQRSKRREEDEEDNYFSSIYANRLQEDGLWANGSATTCKEELKQVIRDRLYRQKILFDHEKASSSKPLMLSGNEAKNLKGPNLIAKLMGLEELPRGKNYHIEEKSDEIEKMLKVRKMDMVDSKINQLKQRTLEEILETMRSKGILKSEQSDRWKYGLSFQKEDNSPPIVIMKPHSSPCFERGELNLSSQGLSMEEMEPVELLSEGQAVVQLSGENLEPNRKFKSATSASQKQLKNEVAKERKKNDEPKNTTIHGKRSTKKGVKTIEAAMNTITTAPINPEKKQKQVRRRSKENKECPVRSASFKSTSSVKEQKISSEQKTIRKANASAKQSKDRNFIRTASEIQATRSNGISSVDAIPKQANKDLTNSSSKEEIRKEHKLIFEVMPKPNQAGRCSGFTKELIKISHNKSTTKNVSEFLSHLKDLLLSSQSFCIQAHNLYGTNVHQPQDHQTRITEHHEFGTNQLLFDCAKELLTRKSQEGKLSIQQTLQKLTANRSLCTLVEEISVGFQKLMSYSEVDDLHADYGDNLDKILEMDLHCNETMLNAIWGDGWDDWNCPSETDQVVFQLEEEIFYGVMVEIVRDLRSCTIKEFDEQMT
ncbi:hypothetical protein AXF42_Ash001147 [Apostasia shenzhenica]|uniref:DUF3741 domain-containing protein n=1 Tax=Apostasia shenzhenica TaxID=1088818 RepID=A0A2I0AU34_9ASPA|nr:hypothetical protein AXF42_Ash001147 [Apostasia shenzhenica]